MNINPACSPQENEDEYLNQMGEYLIQINKLKQELNEAQVKCKELLIALEGCNEMFDTYGFASESPCARDKEIIDNMLKALGKTE